MGVVAWTLKYVPPARIAVSCAALAVTVPVPPVGPIAPVPLVGKWSNGAVVVVGGTGAE